MSLVYINNACLFCVRRCSLCTS